jgi:hypothetical protein
MLRLRGEPRATNLAIQGCDTGKTGDGRYLMKLQHAIVLAAGQGCFKRSIRRQAAASCGSQ